MRDTPAMLWGLNMVEKRYRLPLASGEAAGDGFKVVPRRWLA